MKVFVATHSYTGNGAAVMLQAVMEYWVKTLGWTVDVLFSLDQEVPDELASTGVNAFTTITPSSYDFALVNTIVSMPYVEQLAPRIPTVLWAHEGDTVVWSSNFPPAGWRDFFDLPKKIVFQTTWQAEVVFRSFLRTSTATKIAYVPNGLPRMPEGVTPRSRTAGKKRIVFIGGVYQRKRPNDLIDAVLAMNRTDVECVFVGGTNALDSLGVEHVTKLRNHPEIFSLVGELDRRKALEYLGSADVFCLPSGDESQPIAPVEAAALGVPCVLTDLPPYVGIWKHGINCLMQPVGHVPLLARNLMTAMDDAEVSTPMIAAARTLVADFSLDRFLQRFTTEVAQVA